jgi:hypothetical protein
MTGNRIVRLTGIYSGELRYLKSLKIPNVASLGGFYELYRVISIGALLPCIFVDVLQKSHMHMNP